ncbi:MAG: hypothetical protein ACLU31_02980 [Ezakiella sp.]
MTFDKKIRDKYAAGGYGIGSIFKDTIKFVNKNALMVVIIFSIIVSIIPAITGDGFLIESASTIENRTGIVEVETDNIMGSIQKVVQSIVNIFFLVYFFRKAKGYDFKDTGAYGTAVVKSILMSLFVSLVTVFPLILLMVITAYLPIFMVVVAFVAIAIAYFTSTAQIAIVENPDRKIMHSLKVALETFKKKGYFKNILIIVFITFLITFGAMVIINFAVFQNFKFWESYKALTKIFESGIGGHILIFILSFIFNVISFYFTSVVAAVYLIYSEEGKYLEQYPDDLDEYNEFVRKNYGENESESENRSSFFEEYEKNFYSGKNEEDDSK